MIFSIHRWIYVAMTFMVFGSACASEDVKHKEVLDFVRGFKNGRLPHTSLKIYVDRLQDSLSDPRNQDAILHAMLKEIGDHNLKQMKIFLENYKGSACTSEDRGLLYNTDKSTHEERVALYTKVLDLIDWYRSNVPLATQIIHFAARRLNDAPMGNDDVLGRKELSCSDIDMQVLLIEYYKKILRDGNGIYALLREALKKAKSCFEEEGHTKSLLKSQYDSCQCFIEATKSWTFFSSDAAACGWDPSKHDLSIKQIELVIGMLNKENLGQGLDKPTELLRIFDEKNVIDIETHLEHSLRIRSCIDTLSGGEKIIYDALNMLNQGREDYIEAHIALFIATPPKDRSLMQGFRDEKLQRFELGKEFDRLARLKNGIIIVLRHIAAAKNMQSVIDVINNRSVPPPALPIPPQEPPPSGGNDDKQNDNNNIENDNNNNNGERSVDRNVSPPPPPPPLPEKPSSDTAYYDKFRKVLIFGGSSVAVFSLAPIAYYLYQYRYKTDPMAPDDQSLETSVQDHDVACDTSVATALPDNLEKPQHASEPLLSVMDKSAIDESVPASDRLDGQ